jgi:hypothetical protein
MGEPAITQKEYVPRCDICCSVFPNHSLSSSCSSLDDAVLKALKTHFPRHPGTTNSARAEFYNKFQREADEHDHDFVKKCGGDLDTTLIFVGLLPSPSVLVVFLLWDRPVCSPR